MNFKLNSTALRGKLLASVGPSALRSATVMGAGLAGLLALAGPARAVNLYDGSQVGNQVEINLNTTISYTGFYRVNDPSAVLAGPTNANGNDGDSNLRHGIVGNQFEALPVFDIRDGDFGMHVSGEFYLNTTYLGTNQNNQPATVNPYTIAKTTDYTSATRNINGQNARLLDAFAFAKHTFADDQSISLKVGRQTLLWGQSLFFTNNGLAAGQAPIDVITAEDLANPQSQQVFLPVGQAVVTYQPARGINIQGYYQFEWQPDNLQGVGSYFSTTDILDKGGERAILASVPGFGTFYSYRNPDLRPPSQNGQFGLSVQATLGEWDLGLYGLRYDSKAPEVYTFLQPGFLAGVSPGNMLSKGVFQAGYYQLVYPRDIQIYGASFSTNLGAANVAGEISTRRNMPLVSGAGDDGVDGLVAPVGTFANASTAPLYAVGNTFAAQVSAIYVTSGVPLDPGGITITGETEFNHLISVTQNRAALATGRQGSAAAFEVVATPTYYDVFPNFVLTFPIGIEYNVLGRSEIDSTMQHGTGNFTFGVTGTYESNWIAGLTYKDFLGKADTVYNSAVDRGYLSLNLQHTF
jgi:hypothetical protein